MQPDVSALTNSPLGNFPELAGMYQTGFQLPVQTAQTGAGVEQARNDVENQKAAEAAAKARASAFADASKYKVIQRPDGGYGFYDPDGKEVTAQQYAQIAGKLPSDILKDSQNPIDRQFIQDSQNLANYYKAKAQSGFDPKQKAIAQQIEKQVKSSYGINLANTPHQQILNTFYSNYPTIYGPNQNNAPGFSGNNLFVPTKGGAQAQVEANNPIGFYQSQGGSGGLSSLKKR